MDKFEQIGSCSLTGALISDRRSVASKDLAAVMHVLSTISAMSKGFQTGGAVGPLEPTRVSLGFRELRGGFILFSIHRK